MNNFKPVTQFPIQADNSETMSPKARLSSLKVSIISTFLLFFQTSLAQYDFKELDELLDKYQRQLGNNAVAMIYKDGKIIYNKSMGSFDPQTQAPIASCSKWLTAALVMTFVEEGKLSLNDSIGKYLPLFSKKDKAGITIRQCLSHTTGIASEPITLMSLMRRRRYGSLEEEVNDFAKKEMAADPGSVFRYSNIGLNIAGRVLEVISKKDFETLMQERVFKPLEMNQSSFEGGKQAVNPSGSARSTAADYMHFLVMILNKGQFNNKRILSSSSVELMQRAITNQSMIGYAPKAAEGFDYALGEWVMEKDDNGKSTAVSSPGLFGTWPYVDNCRGYAAIFFIKNYLGEKKKDIYLEMKNTIDKQIQRSCH